MARLVPLLLAGLAFAGCGGTGTATIEASDLERIILVQPPDPGGADWTVNVNRELSLDDVETSVLSGDSEARRTFAAAGYEAGRAATHQARSGRLRSLAMVFLFSDQARARKGLAVIEKKARGTQASPSELDASGLGADAWALAFAQTVPGEKAAYVSITYAWLAGNAVLTTILSGPPAEVTEQTAHAFADAVDAEAKS